MNYEKILKKIRPEKKPSLKLIKELQKKLKNKAEVTLGGSVAKGTELKDNHDIDIFVRFNPKYKNISEILRKALPKNAKKIHGSRDYYQIKKNNYIYEIVPVLKIKNYKEAKNVTDMSPLHVEYIKKQIEKNPKLADEIRLAKQWSKAQKVYGAESYISGLSGHVIDLLITHYKTFENWIRAAAKWKPKVIIDIEKHHKNPLKTLNKSKTNNPLIIIDPIQPDRNAAASVTDETFNKIVQKAKEYIKKPTYNAFKITPMKTPKNAITIKATPLKDKGDIAGAKMKKAYEHITKELKKEGFEIKKTDWEYGNPTTMYWLLKRKKLPKTKIIPGPPTNKKNNINEFKKKHKRTYEKEGRIYAKEERKITNAEELLKEIIKHKEVKTRVKKIKIHKT